MKLKTNIENVLKAIKTNGKNIKNLKSYIITKNNFFF